jgi:hypothetical protein
MKSGNHINPVKVLKGVLIFALGIGVYMTERAFRSKSIEYRNEARRSLTNEQLVDYLAKQPKPQTLSEPLADKLQHEVQPTQTLPNYIIEVKPKAILWKQKKQERREFEKRFLKINVTRWQYPDFVRVPLSSLGVVFYNGQRFYRQGVTNPPEYQKNTTEAETRSNDGLECARKNGPKEHKGDDFGVIGPRAHQQQTSPPVGCCNGVPYNASKRCCCRRASFDKETKFCCALDGCGDFKIYKRDDPTALAACQALQGIVVQEYGYHSEIENYPNFMNQRDPPRRS